MIAPLPDMSLRLGRREMTRLAWVIALSAGIHLTLWGGYELGKEFHLWDHVHLPHWVQALTQKLAATVKVPPPVKPAEREPPLMFVDVSAAQATTEPPRDAAYYSAHNSKAANPDADKDTGIPKIEGTQTQVTKTEDADRNRYKQLQPSPPQPQEEATPKPAMPMGDLALAKPDLNPRDTHGKADEERPRTLQEAYARQQLSSIPGRKMKQDGGVRQRARIASLDAKATPFGAYDQALIEAISQRWYDLLDSRNNAGYSPGRVVLKFQLKYDGTVTDVMVVESNVDPIMRYLCQKAVMDPAPFERWPGDMRRMVGGDVRFLTFAFYYN